MFKVRLKYDDNEKWICADWIWSVYNHVEGQATIIESKHGDVEYVENSVEEILEAIKLASCSGRLYTTDGRVLEV